MKNFMELVQEEEVLLPALKPYLGKENSIGWTILQHPLVYAIPYLEQMNAYYNEQYRSKKQRLREVLDEKNWSTYIWLHERAYRIPAFADISDSLNDIEYWEILGSVWSDSENLWQYYDILNYLIENERGCREAMMDKMEQDLFKKLPDRIKVYRGHQIINENGYSWTMSYWKAKWFSIRFQQENGGVVCGEIDKNKAIALLMGRNEFEIVAHPDNVEHVSSFTVHLPNWLKEIRKEAADNYYLKGQSFHGDWHWDKVYNNAMQLADKIPEADRKVLAAFAYIHDAKRINEDEDPDHGKRGAEWAYELQGRLNLDYDQMKLLEFACKYHNDGEVSKDPTIGACWDADRLDLVRVNIVPNEKYFSTEVGKKLIWKC